MARRRRIRRGVSAGTVVMLTITLLTVGLGAWTLPRLAGNLEDVTFDPGVYIQALAQTQPESQAEVITVYEPAATPVPEAAPTATPAPESRSVTFAFGGQVSVDNTMRKAVRVEGDYYDFSGIFDVITPYLSQADVAMLTLEAATAGADADYDVYNAPDALLTALQDAGVDVINLGTERILDKGIAGLTRTRDLAEQMGFDVVGANRSLDESLLPLTFEVNGVKCAILSYTYGLSSTGSQKGTKDQRAYSVNTLDAARVRLDVKQARAQGAQVVVVACHWGKRSNTKASTDVKGIAESILDCGADAIIGTHPTSVHTMERRTVTWEDGTEHEVFVAYSLGNFLTNERDDTANITGVLLTLRFTVEPGADSAKITSASYLPTWVMRWQDSIYHYRILPSGTLTQPAEMTNSVYRNMRRSYEDMIKKLGTDAALPIEE